MIRINLAAKRKGSYATASINPEQRASGSDFLRGFGEAGGRIIGPLVLYIGIPLGLGFAANYYYDELIQERVALMEKESASRAKDKATLEAEVAKLKNFEQDKQQLEKNYEIITTKIETIEKLIQGRDFATKSLISLAQTLPKEVWLTEFSLSEKNYRIAGSSLDAGLVTDYMGRLQNTIYFKDIQLERTSASDQKGQKTEFSLTGSME